MERRRKIVDDSLGEEVAFLNNHAVFMGYLSMSIKGLGFLVITWTTVVLLGGFVSTLHRKDFWCLAFITLVQTAGIFDAFLNEKLSYIVQSALGLGVSTVFAIVFRVNAVKSAWAIMSWVSAGFLSFVVQLLVYAIILSFLSIFYVFGLLISAQISVWRLIQHDYVSNSAEESSSNLVPALDVLYSLALLQGVLFCYRALHLKFGKELPKACEADGGGEEGLLQMFSDYLRETRIGCEKDPSFARGRNLVTYAVDLMGSNSPKDFLSGARILDTVIRMGYRLQEEKRVTYSVDEEEGEGRRIKAKGKQQRQSREHREELIARHVLMKHLILSASSTCSGHVFEKLLQALDPRSPYSRDTRTHAARVVAHLAGDVHLERFPRGIRYVSSLLDTFQEYSLPRPYRRGWLHELDTYNLRVASSDTDGSDEKPEESDSDLPKAYRELVLQGLHILRELAADEDNCRVMRETHGLLAKIMAPVTSDLLHTMDHGAWSDVVFGSLEVMRRLAAAPGETGAKLRQDISSNENAVAAVERILKCGDCGTELKVQAMGIMTELCVHVESRQDFVKMLVDIFTDDSTDDVKVLNEITFKTGRLAGEALAMMLSLQCGSNAQIVLQVNDDVVGRLTTILVDVGENTSGIREAFSSEKRKRTAEILEYLCIHYVDDDECFKKLKEAMIGVMPKVLKEILLGEEESQTRTVSDRHQHSSPHADIEQGPLILSSESDNKQQHNASSPRQQHKDVKLQEALLSLSVTVCDTFVGADSGLSLQIYAASFPRRLKEMVERNSGATADCLRMLKLSCKMAISMVKQGGSYLKEDVDNLMKALSSASENMFLLDGSIVFASGDDGATTTMKPVRTLASLVEEARKFVATYEAQELGVMAGCGEP